MSKYKSNAHEIALLWRLVTQNKFNWLYTEANKTPYLIY